MPQGSEMRLACWNVEWFDALFDAQDKLLLDDHRARRYGVTRREQAEAVAAAIRAVDPDALLVVEAPNTGSRSGRSAMRALEGFAARFGLRQSAALSGFESETDQELVLLYDPARISARHDPQGPPPEPPKGLAALAPPSGEAPRFDGLFRRDLNGDGEAEAHKFIRPPLELDLRHKSSGAALRLIGAHLKSKAGANGNGKDRAAAAAHHMANRRKQLAEALWLRARIEAHLARGEDLVVLGDFNDGPGLDLYERRLGASSLDAVIGTKAPPERRLRTSETKVRWTPEYGWVPASARFHDAASGGTVDALIDFILISPGLAERSEPHWRIWNPWQDPELARDVETTRALATASDHFPVSLDLRFALQSAPPPSPVGI